MTREDVASQASLSASTVVRIESGRTVPSADALARIAVALGVPMEELFDAVAGTAA
jgi:transcriptional regulator with XRE-family HTH domain